MTEQGIEVDSLVLFEDPARVTTAVHSSRILGNGLLFLNNLSNFNDRQMLAEIEARVPNNNRVLDYDLIISHWHEDWHHEHKRCAQVTMELARHQPVDIWWMHSFPYCQQYSNWHSDIKVLLRDDHVMLKARAIRLYDKWIRPEWPGEVMSMNSYHASYGKGTQAEVFKVENMIL